MPAEHHAAFRHLIRDMLAEGVISLGRGRTLVEPDRAVVRIGVLTLDPRGFGRVSGPGFPAVRIARGKTGDALDGDTVSVRVDSADADHDPPRGRVVSVLQRGNPRWVGTLERHGNHWLVHPQGERRVAVIEVDPPEPNQARAGDLVVVEPARHARAARTLRGVIVERIGRSSSPANAMTGVLCRFGIPEDCPAEVRREAQRAAKRLNRREFARREDLRDTLIVTIDPSDARDFDDAISVTELDRHGYQLAVHIADVAHFVQPDSRLDLDARRRGTSVYLPGRVVPMLPEELCNGVCSLQESQPRLTKTVWISYDAAGAVTATRFSNSVIKSRRRLTYQQVDRILGESRDPANDAVVELLRRAEGLARLIRRRRLNDGMLVLNVPEVELRLADDGSLRDVCPTDNGFSHTIIETFMVEANEAVSRELTKRNVPHLRRIHPPPSAANLAQLERRLLAAGCAAPGAFGRSELQQLLESAHETPGELAVNLLVLRSFGQAVYSPEPVEHFALASEHYCHFTSPIRRYPDLTIHRLFDQHLIREAAAKGTRRTPGRFDALVELGRQLSELERRAQDAERAARSLLVLDMMKSKVGRDFDGIVTGVCSRGVFVQVLPSCAEGFIRLSDLPDDRWRFCRATATLNHRRNQRTIALGQTLRVRIDSVDRHRRDMSLIPLSQVGVSTPNVSPALKPSLRRRRATQARKGRRSRV